jgi:hypothetical protein
VLASLRLESAPNCGAASGNYFPFFCISSTKAKDANKEGSMIKVEVTNRSSDNHGKTGWVSKGDWDGNSFWVSVSIDGRMVTTARMFLTEL